MVRYDKVTVRVLIHFRRRGGLVRYKAVNELYLCNLSQLRYEYPVLVQTYLYRILYALTKVRAFNGETKFFCSTTLMIDDRDTQVTQDVKGVTPSGAVSERRKKQRSETDSPRTLPAPRVKRTFSPPHP